MAATAICALQTHGVVLFTQTKRGCLIEFKLGQFEPFSTHAIHIHEYGDLTGGCASLGGHYNPTKQKHGNHYGDLIYNFTTNSLGGFQYKYYSSTLNTRDIIGRSIVIHENIDDLGTEGKQEYNECSLSELKQLASTLGYTPMKTRKQYVKKLEQESLITGNAGKRMDCGVIGIRKP